MQKQNKNNNHSSSASRGEHGDKNRNFSYVMWFNIPKNSGILDLGCNTGSLVDQLYTHGWVNTYGIDVTEKGIQEGKEAFPSIADRISVFDGNIIPFDDNTFDVITIFDVLEHIPHLNAFLQEIKRVLKPQGILIFGTPNKLTNIPWEIINQRSLTKWREYHCSLQTLPSLRKLLTKNGFHNISIKKVAINTNYNQQKIKSKIGPTGILLLKIVHSFPLGIFPNFYGYCYSK